jgi:hypothetical protein
MIRNEPEDYVVRSLGVSTKFSRGRGAQFIITESTDGVRLQVSFGNETALIYLWQVVEKID